MSHIDPDERPPLWVGHVSMRTPVLEETAAFMEQIGMRKVTCGDDIAILELRGGTHLALMQDTSGEPGEARFDLMFEDVDVTWARFKELGVPLTAIERGRIHDAFVITEPGGNTIVVNSSHVTELPV